MRCSAARTLPDVYNEAPSYIKLARGGGFIFLGTPRRKFLDDKAEGTLLRALYRAIGARGRIAASPHGTSPSGARLYLAADAGKRAIGFQQYTSATRSLLLSSPRASASQVGVLPTARAPRLFVGQKPGPYATPRHHHYRRREAAQDDSNEFLWPLPRPRRILHLIFDAAFDIIIFATTPASRIYDGRRLLRRRARACAP